LVEDSPVVDSSWCFKVKVGSLPQAVDCTGLSSLSTEDHVRYQHTSEESETYIVVGSAALGSANQRSASRAEQTLSETLSPMSRILGSCDKIKTDRLRLLAALASALSATATMHAIALVHTDSTDDASIPRQRTIVFPKRLRLPWTPLRRRTTDMTAIKTGVVNTAEPTRVAAAGMRQGGVTANPGK
jgi:hypothetical protein